MSVINEDLPVHESAENSDLAQLSQADSLIDRGVADPLDEGFVAPDHWSAAQRFGNTRAEMAQGETIEQRVKQEEPEPSSDPVPDWNPQGERRQVGSTRAGRLVAAGGGRDGTDTEPQAIASDVGISGGAASAEEAAMHVIDEEDLARHGDEDEAPGAARPTRRGRS